MDAPEKSAMNHRHANTVTEPNYPRNCRWMAARLEEVSRTPLGVWMLDDPLVLYRKQGRVVAALDNRCPHRWAPLSDGKLDGDDIACPYHGLHFSANGECSHIPSQTQIPAKARVKSYAVLESAPIIWVWMGKPELADPGLLPRVSWLIDPKWSWVIGTTVVNANFRLLKENVLDLTHIPHVHGNSIGASDWTNPPEVSVTKNGHVTYVQDFPAAPLAPPYRMAIGVGADKVMSRKNYGTSFTPCYHQGFVDFTDPAPTSGERSEYHFSVCHITTPISSTQFIYRWCMGWDLPLTDEFLESMCKAVQVGYAEDKKILESVQDMVARDPRGMNYPEVLLQADQAAMRFRRGLDVALAKESKAI